MTKIYLVDSRVKRMYTFFTVIVVILFVIATVLTRFNPFEVVASSSEVWNFVTTDFLPPTLTKPVPIFNAIITTICLAISSTFVAAVMAIIAAMFGSESISPFPKYAKLIRAVATFLRNIPPLVWAFILFSSLGIGTGVGFIALVISTFAFMTRAFIESIDEISEESTESLLVVGASFPQRVFQAVIPSCLQDFISWFLYCIELNIRASTVVGMVGGGGIGLVLFSYLKTFRYQTAAGIILIIAVTIILVDLLTSFLRTRIMQND